MYQTPAGVTQSSLNKDLEVLPETAFSCQHLQDFLELLKPALSVTLQASSLILTPFGPSVSLTYGSGAGILHTAHELAAQLCQLRLTNMASTW